MRKLARLIAAPALALVAGITAAVPAHADIFPPPGEPFQIGMPVARGDSCMGYLDGGRVGALPCFPATGRSLWKTTHTDGLTLDNGYCLTAKGLGDHVTLEPCAPGVRQQKWVSTPTDLGGVQIEQEGTHNCLQYEGMQPVILAPCVSGSGHPQEFFAPLP